MPNTVRYEIDEEIAQGDFATVYRGRDLQLGRAVAIKQLHQQYLNNPKLTERYWQEAQLLATLEHPHVMTIYDVVPQRGWLILELMQGSLKDRLQGQAMGLRNLRLTILFAARALSFFQQHGILHGDVKPSNLLVDRNNRIKLGDFGIARRIQDDDGSAIKGTTRYIAPEVVSDKFGPVGPHSDIYSLGFSAYELLCGAQFESLFPGLHLFGRDQQLAWIMWHSAPDRRLPKIQDVLEGVPADLAAVIQRMTEKDPARRYRSADEVIEDLSHEGHGPPPGPSLQEREEAEKAARQARRKRRLTIGAAAISMVLSLAMLFFPGEKKEPPKPPPRPSEGIVGKIVPDSAKIYLRSEESILVGESDLILLNGAVCQLDELKPNDKLIIKYLKGPEGETKRILATRGGLSQFAGQLADVDESKHVLSLSQDGEEPRSFVFDGETTVSLNEETVTLAELRAGDSIVAHYWADESGAHADSLEAKRQLSTSGVLESFNPRTKEITFRAGDTAMTLALYDDCVIRLNNRDNVAGHVVTLADLSNGDRIVSLKYDARVLSMDLQRDLSDIVEVWSVDAPGRRLSVVLDGNRINVSAPDVAITYRDKSVDLAFLRKGDRLEIAHDSPDRRDIVAKSIEVADLARDPRIIALVISQQEYDSIQVTPYRFARRDAELVRNALDTGARVPDDQLAILNDLTKNALAQAIGEFLAAQKPRPQVIIYFVGQAYVDLASGTTFLATRDFSLDNMEETGLRLRALIEMMEKLQAREKILILDTCHAVSATELQSQPPTEEQIRKAMVGDAVSRSVTVIGSCSAGQRAVVDEKLQHGLFGLALAQALDGKTDTDDDGLISCDDLFSYLMSHLAKASQTPVRFHPDTRPRRLSPEAAQAIRRVLQDVNRVRPSKEFDAVYAQAKSLASGQPDADLAFAIVKLKTGKTGESFPAFLAIMAAHPDALVAFHGATYQNLLKKEWRAAADVLARMVQRIAVRRKRNGDYTNHLIQFAGLAREFIASIARDQAIEQPIDVAAKKLNPEGQKQYETGRKRFTDRYEQLEEDRRKALRSYYRFDFDQVKRYMLDQLEH